MTKYIKKKTKVKMDWEKYNQFLEMSDFDRMNLFMVQSLKNSFPMSMSSSVSATELAFILDYSKIPLKNITTRLVRKTPIVSLFYVHTEKQRRDGTGAMHDYMLEYVVRSDTETRTYFQNNLSTDKLVFAALLAKVDISSEISKMWDLFMEKIVLHPNTFLPKKVSKEIFEWVVQQRCGQELKFLKKTNKKILEQIFEDTDSVVNGHKNNILNTKNDMCTAITDLNTLARLYTNKTIDKCYKKLQQYKPVELDMNDVEYNELKNYFSKLMLLIVNWDDVSTYYCNDKKGDSPCNTTNVQRLHLITEEIVNTATSCSSEISRLVKKRLVARRKSGDKSLSLLEKFRSFF